MIGFDFAGLMGALVLVVLLLLVPDLVRRFGDLLISISLSLLVRKVLPEAKAA